MSESSVHEIPGEIAEIVGEFLAKRQAGESISIVQFADQYPDVRTELLEVLPTVDYLESKDPTEVINPVPVNRLPRELVGEYKLKKMLGFGGMGTVYEAESPLRSRVALKVIESSGDEKEARRFSLPAQSDVLLS